MENIIIISLLLSAGAMVLTRRLKGLILFFALQSFLLALFTILEGHYVVAGLLIVLKVVAIPILLFTMVKEIKANENPGFITAPWLSFIVALGIAYLSWLFSNSLFSYQDLMVKVYGAVSFTMIASGLFIMVFRLKALAQIIGLLSMENGIFLLASSVSGGVPFLVEMAIFFDVFVGVIILGVFVYRINKLFVSIDVSRLNQLRG